MTSRMSCEMPLKRTAPAIILHHKTTSICTDQYNQKQKQKKESQSFLLKNTWVRVLSLDLIIVIVRLEICRDKRMPQCVFTPWVETQIKEEHLITFLCCDNFYSFLCSCGSTIQHVKGFCFSVWLLFLTYSIN